MYHNMEKLKIVIGRTKKGALITVCDSCECFGRPHFNYYSKEVVGAIDMLNPEFIDSFGNLKLEQRRDLEIFLNSSVDIKNIKIKKRKILKYESKYELVEEIDIEKDMTYWELLIKMWNKNNKYKMPKNTLKPYYRNFIEYVDGARFSNKYELEGSICYIKQTRRKKSTFCI